MGKVIKLSENQLVNLIEKLVKESDMPRGGFMYSESVDTELVQDVVDRMTKFHTEGFVKGKEEMKDKYREYLKELKKLNRQFHLR